MCEEPRGLQKTIVIEAGFLIDRSIESISDLAESLSDPFTGDITKKKGDYQVRQGICGQPITQSDLTKNIPVCHAKIRTFEFIVKLLVRYRSHKKWWTPTNNVKYSKEEKELYKVTREKLRQDIYSNIAINIGDPGDMVTGATFHTFSSDSSRKYLCTLVEDDLRDQFSTTLLGICAIVKVINSQKKRVNVDRLRMLGQQIYLELVQCFPWAVVSPSVHRILAHSWEVIQLNDSYGLGGMSEEGLEALNKCIRSMRSTGARKDNTLHNFTDTFHHLWDRSRPVIVEMERKVKRRAPRLVVVTEIEAFVEGLFLEEALD